MKSIYLIGALKNWDIPKLTNELEAEGFEVFSEWLTPGPDADTYLLKYAKERGWNYEQALQSYAAKHVFEFDKKHLDRCDIALAVAPFGKSAMLELGYTIGKGKPGYIYFPEEPERFDVMLQFATGIFFDKQKLIKKLKEHQWEMIPGAVVTYGLPIPGWLQPLISVQCDFKVAPPRIPFSYAVNSRCPKTYKWAGAGIGTSQCDKAQGHKGDCHFYPGDAK